MPDANYLGTTPLRPRVLFMCARLPFPLDSGGKQRTFHLLTALSRGFDVTLLTFTSGTEPARYPRELAELCSEIVTVHNPHIDQAAPRLLLDSLVHGMPFTTLKYTSPQMRAEVVRLTTETRFDLLHIDQLQMAQYVEAARGVPKILNAHNIESQLWQRHVDNHGGPMRAMFSWQQRLVAAMEKRACEDVDSVIACSKEDCEWVRQHTSQQDVYLVANGVNAKQLAELDEQTPQPVEPNTLVFVGSMDWPPNNEGAMHFLREIWPGIKRRVAGARFWVVGRKPSAKLRAQAASDPNVVVTGAVDEVIPYVQRATLCVVPLYSGSGTRLKILEGFALGKCVVSTALGAEGIDAVDGQSICIAHDDAQLADLVVEMLGDPTRAAQIGAEGRQLANHRYEWSRIGDSYLEHAQRISQGAPRPTTDEFGDGRPRQRGPLAWSGHRW